MDHSSVTYEVVSSWVDPQAVQWTTDYLKKLLIERHSIRAAIENPGGSIIAGGVAQAADADQLPSYSSVLGNDAHLDLLEAETEVNTLDPRERMELLAWCDGMTPKQAAHFANIKGGKIRGETPQASRKRLQRIVHKVVDKAQENA